MRVAVCIPQVPFERGGAEIFADDLVEQLRARAHEAELRRLVGNAAKARAELGWRPQVGFEDLVRLLVDAALERLTAS